MDRSKTQFVRLEKLDRLIREGKYPNCVSFAKECEVSTKTIQRDVDYLRDQLGSPIEFDRDRNGYYYTCNQWFLPHTAVNENDLAHLRLAGRALEAWQGGGLAGNLERIRQKLAEGFGNKITVRTETVFPSLSFTGPAARKVSEAVWDTLAEGLLRQREVEVLYRSAAAAAAGRRVLRPYHMANLQGDWYVFGHDSRSGEVRQFALARVRQARLRPQTFRVPEDFDARAQLADTFSRFASAPVTHEVRLEFDGEVAAWVRERTWHPRQKLTVRRDGGVELVFTAKGLFEVYRWVLAWGRHCRVHAPAELKTMVEDEIRAMARNLAAPCKART